MSYLNCADLTGLEAIAHVSKCRLSASSLGNGLIKLHIYDEDHRYGHH